MKHYFLFFLIVLPLAAFTQTWYAVDSQIGLNMREAKGTNSPIVKKLKHGDRVQLIEKDTAIVDSHVWYKVRSGPDKGYVSCSYLKMETTLKGTGLGYPEICTVNTDQLKLRSSKDISGEQNIIYRLAKGDKVTIIEKDNKLVAGHLWYLVQFQDKKGYVSSKYLTTSTNADGVAPLAVEKTDSKPTAKKQAAISKNKINEKYWEDGRKIVKELTNKLENSMLESTFSSSMVSAAFRKTAEKLTNLDAPADIYPEIRSDVNLKIDYLNEVARAVDGSFTNATAAGLKYAVCKILDMAPAMIKKKGYMPEGDVAWLTEKQCENLEKKLQQVNKNERKTIDAVAKKYQLGLKKW